MTQKHQISLSNDVSLSIMSVRPYVGSYTSCILQHPPTKICQNKPDTDDSGRHHKLILRHQVHSIRIFNRLDIGNGWHALHHSSQSFAIFSSRYRVTAVDLSSATVLFAFIYLRCPVKSTRVSENTLHFFKLQSRKKNGFRKWHNLSEMYKTPYVLESHHFSFRATFWTLFFNVLFQLFSLKSSLWLLD